MLTFSEAAQRLNVPESWLREKVARRQVPHTRLGKHVRFTKETLRRSCGAATGHHAGSR
ncbi:MAG: helix-turn-helix domain-containing protein [Streptosporangiales bacterium]|nr:helix-turn-helix domain-containing protein [Streptosporangiales bacterium]